MARRKPAKKHMYWHDSAKVLLEHGMTPTNVAKAIKVVFPLTNVTGRHVGAYKRRLVTDDMLSKNLPSTISMQDALSMVEGIVGESDMFVYKCSIGSAKRTLKCFEYKMTQQAIEPQEDIEIWLSNMTHTTQT
jgi:hypothetical protein|tara:strand:+ start:3346 stop:3744 length:399 start_codon:yes stop_codon:yes gene_type:complete